MAKVDFMHHVKAIAWTEAEVATVVAGAVAAQQLISDEKIFKAAFTQHPEWFTGSREGAPIYIKWSGLGKAAAAGLAATYVKNSWVKLFLMGIAFQGTLQQARILTYDKTKGEAKLKQIGAGEEHRNLDRRLRELAERHRSVKGTEDMDGPPGELGDRYESSVAQPPKELGDRYESAVAGYDELESSPTGAFSFDPGDSVYSG